MPWKPYTKIDTAECRDMDGSKRLVEGTFRSKAVEWMKDLKWDATEKVDGTNVSIHWDGYNLSLHGRTEAAQLPKELHDMMFDKFGNDRTEQLFEQLFPTKTFYDDAEQRASDIVTEATIYGEGIGPKIQKAGKLYGPEYRFLVFDIKVGGTYLDHDSDFYREIVEAMGLEEVPKLDDMTIEEAKAFVKSKPRSLVNDAAPMEGVVLRPKARLYEANGQRLIVKIKCRDYEPYNEYAEKYAWIKRGKAVVYMDETMEPDSRCVTYAPMRCTIKDIVRVVQRPGDSTVNEKIEKVGQEGDYVLLQEIDGDGRVVTPHLDRLSRYDKAKWEQMKKENGNG